MKYAILKVSALFAVLFLFSANKTVEAQYRIYGVTGHLCYFDYSSGEFHTLPEYSVPSPNLSFGCTIDPFNGRYFYKTAPFPNNSSVTTLLLDSTGLDVSPTLIFPDFMEYNCLNNSLIFQSLDGSFWSYDLGAKKVKKLSTLQPFTGILYGETRVYSPVDNLYFNQRWYNDTVYFDVIDGITGEMISSHVSGLDFVESAVVDYKTGYFYGIIDDTVVEFDPITDKKIPIVKLPLHEVHLNNQMAVFDQVFSKYIVPTYNGGKHQASYIVVDVVNKKVDTVMRQPNDSVNWQQIYSKPAPFIVQLGDSLVCPYGKSYVWFCDGDTLLTGTTNSLKPEKNGYYKVEVHFASYSDVTEEIYFKYNGAAENSAEESIKIFPNPVRDKLKIQYNAVGLKDAYLEIFDIQGKIIVRRNLFDKNTVINTTGLEKGVYIVKIITPHGTKEEKVIKY